MPSGPGGLSPENCKMMEYGGEDNSKPKMGRGEIREPAGEQRYPKHVSQNGKCEGKERMGRFTASCQHSHRDVEKQGVSFRPQQIYASNCS